MPKGIKPMVRVVAFNDAGAFKAVALPLLADKKKVSVGDVELSWTAGQNSALDDSKISQGRDVGNVVVRRKTADGYEDLVYDVTFAFVVNAFYPGIEIVK